MNAKIKRRALALLFLGVILLASGCRQSTAQEENGSEGETKILDIASSFAYPSLDTHKESYGWFTCLYGVTENLFRITDEFAIEPWLAESIENEGQTWTLHLKEGITFSSGQALTAEMVVRNLERAGQVNERFSQLTTFHYEVVDEQTITISTDEPYPTMINLLASPELGIVNLDYEEQLDTNVIGTGPFVVESFVPEGDVSVVKNEHYWGGNVRLDGAVFHYLQDDASRLMAMQNGEVDCDNNVSAAGLDIFEQDPETYQITSVPASRLQFYILNHATMDESVREAVQLAIDSESMISYLNGTVSVAYGPFSANSAYGQVTPKETDPQKAMQILEDAGYERNQEGYWERNGEVLSLRIAYYTARSLDTLAVLMQEQLEQVGIQCELMVAEDPDATYIATGDFDIALYCMIADQTGDPQYFIDSTLKEGSYFDVAGYSSEQCETLIQQLEQEMDIEKRAELANQIIQLSIDENVLGYIGLFNKITVMRQGVSGFAETSPFDFYGLNAETDIT